MQGVVDNIPSLVPLLDGVSNLSEVVSEPFKDIQGGGVEHILDLTEERKSKVLSSRKGGGA